MIELYHAPQSTCSQKVRLVLAEKGFHKRGTDWIEHEIDLGKFEQLEPEYLRINPNGVVPTLVHDGRPVTESSAIIEYLDEAFPNPPLSAPDAYSRARMRAWMRYVDEVPTVAVRIPSFSNVLAPMRFSVTSDADFQRHAERLPIRKEFYKRMTQQGFGEKKIDEALAQIRQTCERIEASLAEYVGLWIMGANYTLLDAQLTPLIDRMEDLGYAFVWSDLSRMSGWWGRIKERPSYAEALYCGSRLSTKYAESFKTATELKAIRGY